MLLDLPFDLKDTGFGARNGVKGFGGVILQIIVSSTVLHCGSYIGTEIGYVGEQLIWPIQLEKIYLFSNKKNLT